MFLSRILCPGDRPAVVLRQGREAAVLKAAPDAPALWEGTAHSLSDIILRHGLGDPVDVEDLSAQGRLLLPLWAGHTPHLPLSAAEPPLPLVLIPPGQPFQTAPGLTLEGGIAAVIPAGGAGRVMGWVQYHLASCAALRVRQLSFGPEMAIGDDRPAGGGTGVLHSTDGTARNFPLPQIGPTVSASETPPHTNTLALQRLSRWLIRPASVHSLASLESRHMGAGLPLRNPLQPVASLLAQDQVAEASSPI